MESLIGGIVFLIILAVSVLQKIKEFREDQEYKRNSSSRPSIEDLPEETRRMLYGEPTVRRAESAEEVIPIPVARPQQRPQQRPQPVQPRPVQRQAPPPKPRPQPVQQPRRAVPPPPPPPTLRTREEPQPPRPAPQQIEKRQQRRTGVKRRTPKHRRPVGSSAKRRPRPGRKDTSSRGLALRLVRHPTGIRAAIIANEILGQPKAMRDNPDAY